MTTKAYFYKGESGCRELHAECRDLLMRVRDEMKEAVVPVSALVIAILGFALVFLVWGLWLAPIIFKGAFSPSHLLVAVVWGLAAGAFSYTIAHCNKMSREVSNYLYLRLTELRKQYPDLEGLRHSQVPLQLGDLKKQIAHLMKALESDIQHPARVTFRWDEGDNVEFFSFKQEPY